jgi:hypothetical protein
MVGQLVVLRHLSALPHLIAHCELVARQLCVWCYEVLLLSSMMFPVDVLLWICILEHVRGVRVLVLKRLMLLGVVQSLRHTRN